MCGVRRAQRQRPQVVRATQNCSPKRISKKLWQWSRFIGLPQSSVHWPWPSMCRLRRCRMAWVGGWLVPQRAARRRRDATAQTRPAGQALMGSQTGRNWNFGAKNNTTTTETANALQTATNENQNAKPARRTSDERTENCKRVRTAALSDSWRVKGETWSKPKTSDLRKLLVYTHNKTRSLVLCQTADLNWY